MTVEDGKTVARPETDPARNGYDFVGWYSGEAEYDFSAAVTADLTLTAKWTAHVYTITYKLNGGTNHADNPATYTIDTDDITLKAPTGPATASVFQGWYSDKDFQNRVNPAVITKGSTGNKTFFARFGTETLKEFTVTFNVVADANGTVLGSDSTKVNDGDKISDAQLEAAKAKIASVGDYEYDGLYTNAALTAAFDTATKITADTTLYVKVKAVQKFTVTFDADNGTEATSATVKSGDKVVKPADPTKDGFTFKDWFNGDAEYDFDAPVTGNITLKAKWVAKATEPTEPGVIWTGSVDTGTAWASDATLGIDADKFASCEAGGTFTLYVTLGNESYHQVKLCSNGEGWAVLEGVASDLNANEYNCVTVSASSLSFTMNEADLAVVKANGLRIQGYDVTLTKLTYVAYVAGAETRVVLYEGEGFRGYPDNFDASKLKECLDSSTGSANIVFTYTLGDYAPEFDYDGIGSLTGWDTSGEVWKDSTDNFSNYGFNIPCSKDDYAGKIGTVQTKEFAVKELLSDLPNTHKFNINIYLDGNKKPKAVFTKVEVVYTAK